LIFFVLLLVPDVGILGYVRGTRRTHLGIVGNKRR
jgi:hypothetical protein